PTGGEGLTTGADRWRIVDYSCATCPRVEQRTRQPRTFSAALVRSRMKRSSARFRSVSSRTRRMAEGCAVAVTYGAQFEEIGLPRCRVTLKSGPSSAFA